MNQIYGFVIYYDKFILTTTCKCTVHSDWLMDRKNSVYIKWLNTLISTHILQKPYEMAACVYGSTVSDIQTLKVGFTLCFLLLCYSVAAYIIYHCL